MLEKMFLVVLLAMLGVAFLGDLIGGAFFTLISLLLSGVVAAVVVTYIIVANKALSWYKKVANDDPHFSKMVFNKRLTYLLKQYYFAKDLDRALTDISIVSGRTNEEMLAFADKANVAAKELKTTTLAYTQAALVFYQQGLAADAVQKMTEATIIGANIAGESTETMSELSPF